ncbi:LapA family protein [Tessaracoccus sp. Y1736]
MSSTDKPSAGLLRSPRTWVGIALAIVAVAFILQNRQSVAIDLLMLTVTAPMYLALSSMFLAGLVTCWLITRRRR